MTRPILQKSPSCHSKRALFVWLFIEGETNTFRKSLIVATPYGVATISRLPKNIVLFCKRAL